jgi:2'-5' RNA ligase
LSVPAPDEPATYIIPCLFRSPQIAEYHRELVDSIADRFGFTFTRCQRIPAHFTLKYHFITEEIARVETLLEQYVSRHLPAPVEVGGFGHFDEDVVFVEVRLSDDAKRVLSGLTAALRTLPWMPWSTHDAEHLHPHMTVVEFCRPRFTEVWEWVKTRERHFPAELDNVTILRKAGEEGGIDLWAVHRSFTLVG